MGQSHQNVPSFGAWRDLQRDWQRWSRAERLIAECIGGALMLAGALIFAAFTLP